MSEADAADWLNAADAPSSRRLSNHEMAERLRLALYLLDNAERDSYQTTLDQASRLVGQVDANLRWQGRGLIPNFLLDSFDHGQQPGLDQKRRALRWSIFVLSPGVYLKTKLLECMERYMLHLGRTARYGR